MPGMTTPNPTPPTPIRLPIHQRLPRLSGWILITICLMVGILALAPQQLPVTMYKLSLVTLAAVVGYWIDRSLFPYARPDVFLSSDMLPEPDPEPVPQWDADEHIVKLGWLDTPAPPIVLGLAMLRRAIIVGCAMLAMGLGA